MSIQVFQTKSHISIYIDTPESIARFQELIQRGANLWPDAHPELKAAADMVTTGKVWQPYQEQMTDKFPEFKLSNQQKEES